MKTGFTLIELLVVVLIIGILAAVAVPQYKRAVLKARYTEIQVISSAYKTAAEAYYLANGEYPSYWKDMDLTPPSGCTAADINIASALYCSPKNLYFDLYNNNDKNLVGFYRPNGQAKVAYVQWLDVSTKPGKRECWAANESEEAQNLCRGLNGIQSGAVAHASCTAVGGCTRYELP